MDKLQAQYGLYISIDHSQPTITEYKTTAYKSGTYSLDLN